MAKTMTDKIDTKALAELTYNHALRANRAEISMDRPARILISDLREETGDPSLTAEEVMVAWREQRQEPIECRSENVLVVKLAHPQDMQCAEKNISDYYTSASTSGLKKKFLSRNRYLKRACFVVVKMQKIRQITGRLGL